MSVMIVRLNSGEEVIANVGETKNTIILKNPSILIPSPEGKLLLARWLPYAVTDDGIELDKKHIVFTIKPQQELENHFVNVIVNNLAVPSKKIVEPNLKLSV
jgi:hypothetical protein